MHVWGRQRQWIRPVFWVGTAELFFTSPNQVRRNFLFFFKKWVFDGFSPEKGQKAQRRACRDLVWGRVGLGAGIKNADKKRLR